MLFNSIEYFFFLPLFFFIYWIFQRKLGLQNLIILAGSYYFYGCWDQRFLILIFLSSLVDYSVGLAIYKSSTSLKKRFFLSVSLIFNLGLLFVFKYYNFFISEFEALVENLGYELVHQSISIILPVGISFYTFQTLSYSLDIYNDKIKPSKNILAFFAFVSFFPQLVAGPIERASNLLPQFLFSRKFDRNKASMGLRQVLWGLFKKVAIADSCSIYVDIIFENYTDLGWPILLLGTLLFSFQIYCDFSGYSDIAIGTAKLLGFNLMQNFSAPYFSRSIAEFWRKWHISLSTWFRDYLYFPLGGSKVGSILQSRNIVIVFLVSGLWHGANWTYVIWGAIHALVFLPGIFLKMKPKSDLMAVKALQTFRTFFIVNIAWVFFRADTAKTAFLYLKNMFSFSTCSVDFWEKFDLQPKSLITLFFFLAVLNLIEFKNRKLSFGLEEINLSIYLRFAFYIMLILVILEYFISDKSFIYFQF